MRAHELRAADGTALLRPVVLPVVEGPGLGPGRAGVGRRRRPTFQLAFVQRRGTPRKALRATRLAA